MPYTPIRLAAEGTKLTSYYVYRFVRQLPSTGRPSEPVRAQPLTVALASCSRTFHGNPSARPRAAAFRRGATPGTLVSFTRLE